MIEATLDEWYSLNEAADILGVHADTVNRWCNAGELQFLTRWGRRLVHVTWLKLAPKPVDTGRRVTRSA